MSAKPKDITGMRYGKLTVVSCVYFPGETRMRMLVMCDCGKEKVVSRGNLMKGDHKSCGCSPVGLKHGASGTTEYKIWAAMKRRCVPGSENARHYGDRGIRVCKRWERFEAFFADMGPRPSKSHSIDRVNVNGDYCPSNCRWATPSEQAKNTSRTRMITAFGETKCARDWFNDPRCSVCETTIVDRIDRLGYKPEQAISLPSSGRKRRA